MTKDTINTGKIGSERSLLCVFVEKIKKENILHPLYEMIKIKQKKIKYSPVDKLVNLVLSIVSGDEAVYQMNTTVRADRALLSSAGFASGADQSTVQRTLEACTEENVCEMQKALGLIFQEQSAARQHDWNSGPLILDFDLTGLPCSKKCEGSCKGYFAGCKPGTTGRQLARISASDYDEIVYQEVFPGNTGSADLDMCKKMIRGAFDALGLPEEQKGSVLLRMDGGFGTTPITNYLYEEGYEFIIKIFPYSRAEKWCEKVEQWQGEDCHDREYAMVELGEEIKTSVERPVMAIGVRTKTKKAKGMAKKKAVAGEQAYSYSVLLICRPKLSNQGIYDLKDEQIIGQMHFYDARATIESASIRGDKQGLKLIKRRKHSLEGQEMLILLTQLAHNLLVWMKKSLTKFEPKLGKYGLKRLIRDVLLMPGILKFVDGEIVKLTLSKRHSLARRFYSPIARLLEERGVRLILREI